MIDNDGKVKKTSEITDDLSIPVPAVFVLSSSIDDFLSNSGLGDDQVITPLSTIKNGIEDLVYNSGANEITLPRGVYQISWVYEADSIEDIPSTCTLSSYFVDFPSDNGVVRIHSTAAHDSGYFINHGGTITYTAVLNNSKNWPLKIGRGQSGNCQGVSGITLKAKSTQLTIFKLGDPD